ncbi:MAG: dTDP-4-dehydrorhamnose 3,5-epimerase [Salinivenus sp.]
MNVRDGDLAGVKVIEPEVYTDDRGDFRETWNARDYGKHGLDVSFVQDNLSRSVPGVLRGLHFQNPRPQGKLIMVLRGTVYDVVVDLRAASDTFGEWEAHVLSAENARQLYVPEGFAHGFAVTGDTDALFHYKCTDFYHPEAEGVVRWNDPALDIDWPVEEPKLSSRDRTAPVLDDLPEEQFVFGRSQRLPS